MDRNVLIQEYRDILEFDKMPEELKKYLNEKKRKQLRSGLSIWQKGQQFPIY